MNKRLDNADMWPTKKDARTLTHPAMSRLVGILAVAKMCFTAALERKYLLRSVLK